MSHHDNVSLKFHAISAMDSGDNFNKGFQKRLYDPEASLRSSDGAWDGLVRRQNTYLEDNLEPASKLSWLKSSTAKCIMLAIVIPVAIILALVIFKESGGSSDGVCFVENSCNTSSFYDKATGFTNDTGWLTSSSSSCCDICSVPDTPTKICFDLSPGSNCMSKAGVSGDYDFIMLDQIWLPQFCHALNAGYDPTLSHLEGSVCNPDSSLGNKLIVHGF